VLAQPLQHRGVGHVTQAVAALDQRRAGPGAGEQAGLADAGITQHHQRRADVASQARLIGAAAGQAAVRTHAWRDALDAGPTIGGGTACVLPGIPQGRTDVGRPVTRRAFQGTCAGGVPRSLPVRAGLVDPGAEFGETGQSIALQPLARRMGQQAGGFGAGDGLGQQREVGGQVQAQACALGAHRVGAAPAAEHRAQSVQVGAQVVLALDGRAIGPESRDQGLAVDPAATAVAVRGQAQQQGAWHRGRHGRWAVRRIPAGRVQQSQHGRPDCATPPSLPRQCGGPRGGGSGRVPASVALASVEQVARRKDRTAVPRATTPPI
jgi:hypothetical protein